MSEEFPDGFYWLISERSSFKSIAQRCNGSWYLINETGNVSLYEIERRGWFVHSRVKGQKL